jgi:hypothetical protein
MTAAPHWEVLLAIARGVDDPGPIDRPIDPPIDRLLRDPGLSWGELLEQALRQKMLPLVAEHVTRDGITAPIPVFVARHLQTHLDVNRHRLAMFRAETVRVGAALAADGIRFVVTKGMSFERALYPGGTRFMNDLDLMIAPADRDRTRARLAALGYREGLFDWRTGAIRPHSRKRAITYQLHRDHLPFAVRLTGDPIVPSIACDVANSLTWHASEYQVPIDRALADTDAIEIDGARLPIFAPPYQFVFTALHLFREAWLEQWIDWEQDVNLIKFADLVRLWRHLAPRLDAPGFGRLADELGVAMPIAWVFEHLDRTLGTDLIAATGLSGRVPAGALNIAAGRRGEARTWTGTMDDRLRAKDRRALFTPGEPA